MPYKDARKARANARVRAARYRLEHRARLNAQRRKAYSDNLESNRAALRVKMRTLYRTSPKHRKKVSLSARERNLWVCYRITVEEYEAIFKHQGGVCAGCGDPPRRVRLAVDHDHKTGRIRGLLCWLCNRAIGLLRDDGGAASRLGIYLSSPTAPAALGKETYGLLGRAKASKKKKVYGPPGKDNG